MTGRNWVMVMGCGLMLASLAATGCKSGGGGGEVAQVNVRYTVQPTMDLPRGLERVAVLDAETTDDAEKKWSELAANMISGLLDQAARSGAERKLTVVDRQNLKKVMAEKDLALSGLISGARAAEASKLLGVQGMIASSIKVKVEKHTGKGRTLSAASVGAWARGGWGSVDTEEVEKVTRNITVQCHFRLLDAANAKVLIDHVSPTLRKTDKTETSAFFGSSKTEAELTPRDKIIGELVEKEVRKFIGQFFPISIDEVVTVESSGNDACKAGVRFLSAGEYDEAIRMFDQAIASSEGGDKYAAFGKGVAYEAKGDYSKALDAYRTAVRLDAPGAEAGMVRVKAHSSAGG